MLSLVERLVTVIARTIEVVLVLADGSTKPRHALEFREVQHAELFDLMGDCEFGHYKLPLRLLHSASPSALEKQ